MGGWWFESWRRLTPFHGEVNTATMIPSSARRTHQHPFAMSPRPVLLLALLAAAAVAAAAAPAPGLFVMMNPPQLATMSATTGKVTRFGPVHSKEGQAQQLSRCGGVAWRSP